MEERWGVTELIADRGWFREVGRLSWREATVYLVGDKTGLVIDPWFLSRRAYVFDETCRVGPSPVPETLNPGFNVRRKNKALRLFQGTQILDLAMPAKAVDAVALLGVSAAESEPVSEMVDMAVPERRLARIARADQRAARRHAFFARINARSKTNRWVAAACSLFYLTMAGGLAVAMTALGDFGGTFAYPALILLATAGSYAGRVIFRDNHEAAGAPTQDTDSGP